MKKIHMIAALLGMLLPTMVFGTSHYYAALKTTVKSGSGSVYAATSATSNPSYSAAGNTTSNVDSPNNSGGSVGTFYAYAKPDAGWTFVKWTDASGNFVSNEKEYGPFTLSASTTKNGTKTTEYQAYFEQLPPVTITFAAPVNGSYTVNGEAVSTGLVKANQTPPYSATLVATPAANFRFAGWYVLENGSKSFFSTDVSTTKDFEEDATVGAEFIPDGYAIYAAKAAKGYDDLATALAEATSGEAITVFSNVSIGETNAIPVGVSLTVNAGATVTISSSAALLVDGTLVVNGTVSGVVSKCATLFKQEGVNDGNGNPQPITAYETVKYWKTKNEESKANVTGYGSTLKTHLSIYNGYGRPCRMVYSSLPAMLTCNVDSTVALNHITGIIAGYTNDKFTTAASSSTSQMILLLSDLTFNPGSSSKYTSDAGILDCASKKFKLSGYARGGYKHIILNGAAEWSQGSSSGGFYGKCKCINCSSVTIANVQNAGANWIEFYDCTPSKFITAMEDKTSTTFKVRYYSGGPYATSTFTGVEGCYELYGGCYTTEPKSTLIAPEKSGTHEFRQNPTDNYWYLMLKGEDVAQVGNAKFQSFDEAFTAAMKLDSATITILKSTTVDKSYTIGSEKSLRIEFAGCKIVSTAADAFLKNYGTLELGDQFGNFDTAGIEAGIVLENHGTVDVCYGAYTGNIRLSGGTFTTHHGLFDGSLLVDDGLDAPMVADIRGGVFTSTMADFLHDGIVQNYYQKSTEPKRYWVGRFPQSITNNTSISGMEKAWSLDFLSEKNLRLYKNASTERSAYEGSEWQEKAELSASLQAYLNYVLDCSIGFDVAVTKETVTIYAPYVNAKKLDKSLLANERYSLVVPSFGDGYTPWTFDDYIANVGTSKCGVTDGSEKKNAGAVFDVRVQLCKWNGDTSNQQVTGVITNIAVCRYMLGGKKAAIDRNGSRLAYDSLAAAVSAAQDGETVLVGADSAESVTLAKAGTFIIDPYGFNWTGSAVADDGLFFKSQSEADSLAVVQSVESAMATTYVVAQKVASVGGTFYDNLTEAVGAANGATVTLLAATDETIALGEGQSLKLAVASGVSYDAASKIVVDSSLTGYGIKATAGDGYTLYEVIQSAVSSGGSDYASVEEAISDASGDTVEVTVTADITEEVSLDAGKTLSVTVNDGVEANVTVNPVAGAFIDATTDGNTTTYESKKITVEMAEPQSGATVEVTKIEGGTETTVSDSSEINAAVTHLMGNHDVPRTDNTDKLDVLDKITVTPTKIVQEVVGAAAAIIRAATFDVVPTFQAGQSLGEGQKLKFRLPVDAAATQLASIIYHNGEQFGVYPVQTENGQKFVEVESDTFSPYGYELLDGETENPIAAIGTTGYATLAAAIAAANATAGSDTVTIMILQASVTTGDSTITHNVFIDTELAGGATINFNGSSFTARGGAVVTFADDVAALGNVVLAVDGGSPAVSDAKLVLSNNVQALYMMPNVSGGEICIEPSARVSINNDSPIYFATGKVTVNGNLAAGKGLTATSAEIAGAQQLTGGYMFLYFGNNTVELNDTYATSLYVDPYTAYWISAYGSSVAFNLNNSTLYLGNPLGENGGKGFNMGGLGTMTMVGSRLIANGTVTLNSGDVVNMSGKSAITAAAFGNSGVINVDVSTIEETDLPFTIITVTGGGTVTPGAINLTNIPDDKGYVVSVDGNKIALEKAVASITSGEPVVTNYFTTLAYAVAAAEAQTPEPTIRVYDTSAAVPEGWHLVTEGGITTLVRTTFYNVWVGGTQITSANAADVFGDGKVSYDDATKTLTLNGYTYSGAGYGSSAVYIGDMGGATFNVVVAGENSLTSTAAYGYAIRSVGTGAVTVTGSGSDPSLALTVPSAYDTGYAVSVKGTSATFKDLSMAVTGYLGFVVNGNNAAGDALTIDNCDITFAGTAMDQAVYVQNREAGEATLRIVGSALTGAGSLLVHGENSSGCDADVWIEDSEINLTGAYDDSRHGIEVYSSYGDATLVITNCNSVTIASENAEADAVSVIAANKIGDKGSARLDIVGCNSVSLASDSQSGVTVATWDDTNATGEEATINILRSTVEIVGDGAYGLQTYGYGAGETHVSIIDSEVDVSANWMAIQLGAEQRFSANVGEITYAQTNSEVYAFSLETYGLTLTTLSTGRVNTDASVKAIISGGLFDSTGAVVVQCDDPTNAELVMTDGAEVNIDSSTATETEEDAILTGGKLTIDSGKYSFSYPDGLSAATNTVVGNITGGIFTEDVSDLCAEGYIAVDNTDAETKDAYPYMVRAAEYVAQIVRDGEVIAKYETFTNALEVAESGDTIQLLADVTGVTTTYDIEKTLTIDGQGQYKIVAGPNPEPRNVISAWSGPRVMFDMTRSTANVTFKDITLDNGEGHYYSYFVRIKSGTATFEDVVLLRGAEKDSSGTDGAGYGAAILADGGNIVVKGDFYADTHGEPLGENEQGDRTAGIFPFTAILHQRGGIYFHDGVNANIGQDLLLVGKQNEEMLDASDEAVKAQIQEMLDAMNVPAGYVPYTLNLADSAQLSFIGASPLGWNNIIDYGKDIMEVAADAYGMTELDTAETPVEVGLLEDTVLPETFTYEDSNFTINGNGNALSGTIEYTDDAGTMENIVMGTDDKPLVLDMTGLSEGNAINLGSSIAASNVTIKVTEEQATTLGQAIVTWNAEGESEEDAASLESGIKVEIVNDDGDPVTDPVTGDPMEAAIIWDAEMGVAYIGPCEARLSGPTHESPIYTSLASAIARAADSGDTVTLLTNIVNFTGMHEISKSLTLDGAGHKIAAAPVATHRDVVHAWAGSTSMFKLETGNITIKNIELDGDATHAYTFLISADNSSVNLTTENIRLLNGGELCGDANGDVVEPGAGYGAAIHLNNGAHLTVKDGFYADTHGAPAEPGQTVGMSDGVFPFTGILPEGGSSVLFDLTEDTNAEPTVEIGKDLLLVGMVGAIDSETAQGILDYMKVPSRFRPYTLTLGDGSAYAFTGASLLGWNEIIEYGKEIMDVSTAVGYEGLDKDDTPVEVGLLTDTVLPDKFVYEDSNFTVNGNGNALSGTIKYTDEAGVIENIVLGTEEAPLVLDLRNVTDPVEIGSLISVSNVTVLMTEEQAQLGQPVFTWNTETAQEPENSEVIKITVMPDAQSEPQGDEPEKDLVWDDELGIAYIGPCEARLTGPGKDPGYMDLTNAFKYAVSGDVITLFWSNVTLNASVTLPAGNLLFTTNKYELAVGEDAEFVFTNVTSVFRTELDVLDELVLDGDCATGYLLRYEEEGSTNKYSVAERGIYIVTGNTEDGSEGTATIKVSDEWVAANVGDNIRTANEVEDVLNSADTTTGMRKWEAYVLKQTTAPFKVTSVNASNDSLTTSLGDPEETETTGFTVAYSLAEADASGVVVNPGTPVSSRSFTVPVDEVTSNAFYRVRAHLTSGGSTLVVDSTNTIGVLKVDSVRSQTILAVPWADIGSGEDVAVSDLMRTKTLTEGDTLYAYDAESGKYKVWELSASKEWEPIAVSTKEDCTPGESAGLATVKRGTGLWLERANPTAALHLVGEVSTSSATSSLVAASEVGKDGKQGWNVVAPPSALPYDLNSITPAGGSFGTYDRIVIPTTGAPKNYTYENGSWGYYSMQPVYRNGVQVGVRSKFNTEDTKIPAGTGFWYLNSGNSTTVTW